ncbi:PQQ-dependent sugar dehydrogenase [bacterium]|nr:PQQ-dependent sugar dehydrogenase [bacterium]
MALALLGAVSCPRQSQSESSAAASEPGRQPQTQSAASTVSAGHQLSRTDLQLDKIRMAPGFRIEVFAEDVPYAREMCLSPRGVLYCGSNRAGKVYAVVDSNQDFWADEVLTLAENLHLPVGVDWHEGSLYFSEVSRISRIDNIDALVLDQGLRGDELLRAASVQLVTDDLPSDEHHGWKFIRFGPDNKLYVPVGAPCNICEVNDPYATILRMNADGSGQEVVARGIRNTVGFCWHPVTGEMYFTDNGRDNMGDDMPPCELNRIPAGSASGERAPHYGYPYWHGRGVQDPEYGRGKDASMYTAPVQDLGPHVAPLGCRFYTGDMFPEEYHNQILFAEHGSWNRSQKIGYRVRMVSFEGPSNTAYGSFAEGWLQPGDKVWGRPADVQELPDGSLLVSDDHAGCIYRISYSKP